MRGSLIRPTVRQLLLLVYIVGFSLWPAGCVQSIHYQANSTLLQEMSREEATDRIRITLLRSVNPKITQVTVTDEFLTYDIHPSTVLIRLFFGKVSGVEVFDNHAAFVRGTGKQFIAQLFFGTENDAKTFADLLMSFRAAYLAQQAPSK